MIDVYVTDDRSQPVAKVEVVVVAVDAIPVFDMGGGIVTSDEGFAQLSLPDGSVTLRFRAGEIEKQVEVPAFPERKSWLEVQLNR